MRRPRRGSRAAFTLIEVLLASVAATTLGVTLMMSLMGSLDGFATITAQSVLQTELGQALDRILRDTKEARQAVSSWTNGTTYTMDTQGGGADGDAWWILEVPSIDAAGDTLNAPSATYQDHIIYHYVAAAKQLWRIVVVVPGTSRPDPAPDPGRIIANNVERIEFKLPPPLSEPVDVRTEIVDVWIRGVSTQRGRAYRLELTKQAVYRSPAPP